MAFNYEIIPYYLGTGIIALTFHEWARALTATCYGDDTAKFSGRLSLNPLDHLDILGTIMVALFGFGWAKPVPVNPGNFRSKWAEFSVALSGPAINIVIGIIFTFVFKSSIGANLNPVNQGILANFLQTGAFVNFWIAFFNLIPLGSLAGQQVLAGLLPSPQREKFNEWNAEYGSMVLIGLMLLSFTPLRILGYFVHLPAEVLFNVIG